MSKLYAIHAYESVFQGLHGVEDYCVAECLNLKEAEDIAADMSYQVRTDYDYLFDENELEDEGIAEFEIWEVKENTKSLEELNEMFYNDPQEFVENFCEEI